MVHQQAKDGQADVRDEKNGRQVRDRTGDEHPGDAAVFVLNGVELLREDERDAGQHSVRDHVRRRSDALEHTLKIAAPPRARSRRSEAVWA